jgi:hypothetical protein
VNHAYWLGDRHPWRSFLSATDSCKHFGTLSNCKCIAWGAWSLEETSGHSIGIFLPHETPTENGRFELKSTVGLMMEKWMDGKRFEKVGGEAKGFKVGQFW